MAKMLKKLQQKVTPAEKPKPVRPPGKDYMLLILMAFTVMVVLAAWEELDSLTLTMYVLLTASLGLTYVRRQAVPDDDRDARQLRYHRHGGRTLPLRCVSTLLCISSIT